uniref:Thiazole synthase n=1 Tax=Dichotomaria marginata TaxID=268567 RepID=A0A1G4NS00_9FLOR|nr:thiG protein [Dichotomaria marginata]SCW21452.1 thiG protein [Dichotomaria marginata]
MIDTKIQQPISLDKDFIIANKVFNSRLMLGTGKYESLQIAQSSIHASGASIITAAIRRLQNANYLNEISLFTALDWNVLWLLPNTAGCTTVEEAVRAASLGREICKRVGQDDNNFIKLEVISDYQYLLPDPVGTLKAAEYLIKKQYTVLPYIYPDPILAKQLEELGCSSLMPLGSPIGSGQGLKHIEDIKMIIENSKIPVIVDAGIGTASDAVQAMEIGASAVLTNSAIAHARYPHVMAHSIQLGVQAGRYAYIAGRMQQLNQAQPSSPITGISS